MGEDPSAWGRWVQPQVPVRSQEKHCPLFNVSPVPLGLRSPRMELGNQRNQMPRVYSATEPRPGRGPGGLLQTPILSHLPDCCDSGLYIPQLSFGEHKLVSCSPLVAYKPFFSFSDLIIHRGYTLEPKCLRSRPDSFIY